MTQQRITIIGGTGYSGSAIALEAKQRGHAVSVVSRSLPATPLDGVNYIASPATSPEALAAAADADVVVAALSPRGDMAGTLPRIYGDFARQAAQVGARLVVVGGFSCLRFAPGAARIIENPEGFPPEVIQEALENFDVLKLLLADSTGVDWLFACPGMEFGAFAPGEALGRYRVGDDVVLQDENGKSAISGADFAHAVLDEIETPTRHRALIHFAY